MHNGILKEINAQAFHKSGSIEKSIHYFDNLPLFEKIPCVYIRRIYMEKKILSNLTALNEENEELVSMLPADAVLESEIITEKESEETDEELH